ncbi:MAG: radical SAM protein [Theionarchaea archaeon]|nr:radical SAM protein [Theionarchaea archaeon]
MPMKSSLFNVFMPAKNGYALYNTLNESILFCDEELKNAVENNDFDVLSPEYREALKKYGVITEESTNELLIYQYRYNCRVFDTNKIQFTVVTTYACNLACPYCYEGKGEIYSGEMDYEVAEKVLRIMQDHVTQLQSKYVTLILFGGEPLLNLEVGVTIVKKMKEWCTTHNLAMRTFMVTNSTLLTKDKILSLKNVIDGFQITFDGSQSFHDTTRIYKNGKGTYTDVLKAVGAALSEGIDVSLRIQVSKENSPFMHHLFQDLAPYLETGKISLNIAPLSRYSGMCSNFSSHFLEKEEQETVLPAILQYNPHLQPAPNYIPCVAFTNSLIFDGNGSIYKCITTVGEDKRSGYIGEKGIVWEPELYTFMTRAPERIDECRKCSYLPLCGGGCPRTAYLNHKTYEKNVCGGSKKVYFEIIRAYLKRKFPERVL